MNLKNQNLFCQSAFINGNLIDKKDKISVFNPADESLIGMIPNLDEKDVADAIEKAKTAFEKWKKLTGKERAKLLRNWHDLILKNIEDLALILTTEQGKPLVEARGEIAYGASFIEWFAEEAKRIYGDVILAPKANHQQDDKLY